MAQAPYVGDALLTTFETTVNGVPTDPATVTLEFWPGPNEPATTWTLGVTGSIQHVGVGLFRAVFNSTAPGESMAFWSSTGAAACSALATIQVQSKPRHSPVPA